jgi:outer membrane protein assembly factor BamB
MRYVICTLLGIIILSSSIFGQIEIVLDNDTEHFSVTGTWIQKSHDDAIGETARYKRKGDGSNVARWQTVLTWPAPYMVEIHTIDGNYATDARFTIHMTGGDTTVHIDQYHVTRWDTLGTFDLPESAWVELSDYFEGTGRYVLADAVRLTIAADLYSISGLVTFSDDNNSSPVKIDLCPAGKENAFLSQVLMPENRDFLFDNILEGWYQLQCSAWGYDTVRVDSIHLSGEDIIDLNLIMDPVAGNRYSISGAVALNDANTQIKTLGQIYPLNYTLPAASDSITHNGFYSFENLLEGNYRLVFTAKNYTPDTTSYPDVALYGENLILDTVTLYRIFKFAWISDTHVGAGFTESGLQQVVSNINSMQDELDFVINTGDLTEKGLNWELAEYQDIMSNCQIPVWSIPGNHDTKWSESGLQQIKKLYGSLHFTFVHHGFKFIAINSGIPLRGGGGYFDPVEIEWLAQELANMDQQTMPLIVAWHHPGNFEYIFNYWKVIDLLKQYNTAWIMVGHGHSNHIYNFESVPGVMCLDTYQATSGFNMVSVSEKEIKIQTYYTGLGMAQPWFETQLIHEIQPDIIFSNLSENETISGSRNIQIQASAPCMSGTWDLRYDDQAAQDLSGNNTDWNLNLDSEGLENGYHTLNVCLTDSENRQFYCTRGFFVENGYPMSIWKINVGAEVITKPACDTDNVYVGTSDGKLIALDLEDGSEKWPAVQTSGSVFSSPTIYDNAVYVGSADGKLYVIDANDGSVLWTFDAGGACLTPITVVDTLVYFAGANKFYAVGSGSHKKIWEYPVNWAIEAQPVIKEDKIIFGAWDTAVHALNRFSGERLWRWARNSSFYYSPAACWPVANDMYVFVTDPNRYNSAINLADGSTLWSNNTPEVWESIGMSDDGSKIYTRSLDGNLYAFSATTGSQQQLWKSELNYGWDSTPSMPIEQDGVVFTGSKNGFVVAVSDHDGSLLWKYWLGQSYVTTVTPLSNSQVIAAGLDGTIARIAGDPALKIPEARSHIPLKNKLYSPYPNPFNNSVVIKYALRESQDVKIKIYNILGKTVFTLKSGNLNSGEYTSTWDGINHIGQFVSSGIYFVNLQGEFFSQTAKILMIK